MQRYILAFILASAVGIIGGIQGNAGALYMLTGLLMSGIVKTQTEAAGTTLLYTSVPLTLAGAMEYYRQGNLDLKLAGILIIAGFIFSFVGARLNYYIPEKIVLYSTGVLTLISSGFFFYRAYYN